MQKLSYEEFRRIVMDLSVPDEKLGAYLMADPFYKGSGFNPRFVPDPSMVDITMEDLELESALGFGNAICRWRRQRRFKDKIEAGDRRPVLVSEGDSWWQFPFLIKDVIDHLGDDYLIWSLGAAGDTAANMTGANSEYMRGLDRWADRARAFLFSAAGNDIIGEDLTGRPVLEHLLKPYQAGKSPEWHIEPVAFDATMRKLLEAYQKTVSTIRGDRRFLELPILIHGYDYPYPFPYGDDDNRDPSYAASDEWLGAPFAGKGFPAGAFRRAILIVMLDRLYAMLHQVASADPSGRTFVVDARGSLPHRDDWADEIHGTSDGFEKVAERFRKALISAL